MEPQRLIPGDSTLVENIVNYLKAKGIFDEFRHECLADVDTKSSCQNLSQRVDGYASKFLANETWHPELNKNELRNKLRRHIDESGMLAIGADHVVEQVINPKIHQLFLPKIIEVVHQYMKEQNEILNKKPEASPVDSILSENASDNPDSNKAKASVSDPIADILSFSYSKTKPTPVSSSHGKTDNTLQKHTDLVKAEKKKEEKSSTILEKNVLESPSESHSNPVATEVKPQIDKEKEKIKKEEPEVTVEAAKKAVKEEIKLDKKKIDETKTQISELATQAEENKTNVPPAKPNVSNKKDIDKSKQKPKSVNTHKSSGISSDVKKSKKESLDKSSEKQSKCKLLKSSKEASSPTKSVSSVKSISKEEKGGEISKSKPSDGSSSKTSDSSSSKTSDGSSSKTSESSQKKSSKSNSNKMDVSSKHKSNSEKSEKSKISKSSDKNEQNLQESANTEKGMKNILYSSSYDSSQGSDQEKSSSSSSKKERQKYFSKHTKKEDSEKHSDKSSKLFPHKRHSKEADNSPLKKRKNEKFKETVIVGEAAKISSRSNSFGSTSSVSSSSNTSKDNLISNSDEASENSKKDKKNKQTKEKEPCHISKTLPPPPPPPPPSSSLSCELTSSAEVSSIEEDTQSSSNSENSSSEELSEQSSSDSEGESKELILNTLNENLINSSTDDINDFYDIFLYSSSSSEFEGYGDSPDKKRTESVLEKINESDISVSSVHTSDLSSYDDELSDDDDFYGDESQPGVKKRLTLKEAEELIRKRSFLQSFDENKNISRTNKSDETAITFDKRTTERSSSFLSSEDESSPSEPKRSLRRERKLNPRYASSEYTSIFNSRKETFITKQSTPYTKNQTPNSSPINEVKYKKESVVEKDRSLKKNSVETRIVKIHQDNTERSRKTKRKVYTSTHLEQDKEFSDSSQISISDEMDSITDKEKLFCENNESNNVTGSELKLQIKLKPQSISNYTINSYSVKRKLKDAESIPPKRPCSRGSVDSSSSECVPNENKPFNSEKQDLPEEKAIRDVEIKVSEFADAIKKELFCKQRTNNNGDILGQKDIFPIHSHGKSLSTPERRTSETENSKELSAL